LEVTLLLCDAAQEAGGKLHVIGGGWSLVNAPNTPINMALAVLLVVDWNEANDPHQIEAKLMTDDGEQVEVEGQPVLASGQIEVGRPAGIKRGMALNTPLAFTFNGVALPPGGYRWELHVNGDLKATAPFRVMG
jgi:hypothetical protein